MAKSSSGRSGGGTSGSASSKGAGGTQGSKSSSGKSSGGGFGSDKSSSGKDWSPGPSTSTSKTGFSVSGQTGGGGSDSWGWDRNKDGNISLAEKALDMIDGGGKGKTGPTFEGGIFSGALNAAGVSPYGQGSGAVSNVVDRFLAPAQPQAKLLIDVLPHMPPDMKDEIRPILGQMGIDVANPPPETPTTPEGEQPYMAPVVPSYEPVLPSNVAFNPQTEYTFEQYLAQLGQLPSSSLAPPPVLGMPPQIEQGIASLTPIPVSQPMAMNPSMAQPMGMASAPAGPPLYFDALGRPMGLMG